MFSAHQAGCPNKNQQSQCIKPTLIVQAVNYAFIAAPEFPCKDGTLQTDATCLGHWIVANKKLVPKCYELLRHGHLLFLRNTGVSINVCYELH